MLSTEVGIQVTLVMEIEIVEVTITDLGQHLLVKVVEMEHQMELDQEQGQHLQVQGMHSPLKLMDVN